MGSEMCIRDWLLHEAFCLESEADIFHPYEKHHSTVADASKLAEELHVKNLLLYHTEDINHWNYFCAGRFRDAGSLKKIEGNVI